MKFRKLLYTLVFLCTLQAGFAQAPGCPGVTISAPGASQGQVNIPCNSCITLTANVLATGLTTSYAVSTIPYAPPFPFTGGTQIPITSDDDWSGVITIPFSFCFYGDFYSQLIIGDNGVISFNTADAGGHCPFPVDNPIPYIYSSPMHIFGAYHDTYLPAGGQMFYSIEGSYPCRMFVFKFNNVPHFSCNNITTTQMIILYESTNAIEVYIASKPVCPGWHGGRAIVGVQNYNQTVALAAPGRNATTWTATNEAWRFTPNGAQNFNIQWYEGPILVGTGTSVQVCPTVPTTYNSIVTYDNCNFTQVVVNDQITVIPGNVTASVSPVTSTICQGQSVSLAATASGTGSLTYSWSPSTGLSSTTGANVTASPPTTTTYTVTVSESPTCTATASATVTVNPLPVVSATASVNPICLGHQSVISASGAQTFNWTTLGTGQSHTVSPSVTTTYQVTGTDANGCTGSASTTLQVNPSLTVSVSNPTPDICYGESALLNASGGISFVWSTAENIAGITVSPLTTTTYQVTGTDANGCTGTASSEVIVHSEPSANFTATPLTGCIPVNVYFTNQVVSGDPIATYHWQFGSGGFYGASDLPNPSKIFSQSGSYDVSLAVSTAYGCQDTIIKQAFINTYPNPEASFFPDPPVAELGESEISFVDESLGATMWHWDFGDNNSSTDPNPVHLYEIGGQFPVVLVVANDYGCVDSTWRYVQILYSLYFYVPNAFTPGKPGPNDTFGPTGVGIKDLDFNIYDRWGKLVFHTNSPNIRWDGKIDGTLPAATSVYIWKANVVYDNNIREQFSGSVVLIQ